MAGFAVGQLHPVASTASATTLRSRSIIIVWGWQGRRPAWRRPQIGGAVQRRHPAVEHGLCRRSERLRHGAPISRMPDSPPGAVGPDVKWPRRADICAGDPMMWRVLASVAPAISASIVSPRSIPVPWHPADRQVWTLTASGNKHQTADVVPANCPGSWHHLGRPDLAGRQHDQSCSVPCEVPGVATGSNSSSTFCADARMQV
jgi:hypothetical protein